MMWVYLNHLSSCVYFDFQVYLIFNEGKDIEHKQSHEAVVYSNPMECKHQILGHIFQTASSNLLTYIWYDKKLLLQWVTHQEK